MIMRTAYRVIAYMLALSVAVQASLIAFGAFALENNIDKGPVSDGDTTGVTLHHSFAYVVVLFAVALLRRLRAAHAPARRPRRGRARVRAVGGLRRRGRRRCAGRVRAGARDRHRLGHAANCHAYWPLTEPLARDEVERANRRLAHALGADPASADAARILRVPGTLSHKHEPPTRGRCAPARPRAAGERGRRRRRLARSAGARPRCSRRPPRRFAGTTRCCAIAPDVYVRRLLGVEVPRHRKVPCPFHEDRHASLHVYETPERGWYCFGACRRGGTIYDLAAPLYGYAARGEDFLRLRAELRRLFGLEAA